EASECLSNMHVDARTLASIPTRRSSDLDRLRDAHVVHYHVQKNLQNRRDNGAATGTAEHERGFAAAQGDGRRHAAEHALARFDRSEEHTSELQSRENLVCRLLLEKKKRD